MKLFKARRGVNGVYDFWAEYLEQMLSLNLVTRLSGRPIRLQGTGINDIQEKDPRMIQYKNRSIETI
jgi:hypothetical protein